MKTLLTIVGLGLPCSIVIYEVAKPPEPVTPIMRRVMAAGAGDVRGLSPDAMRHWFAMNADVGTAIGPMCLDAMVTGPMYWADTTDGKLCAAARSTAHTHMRRDHTEWTGARK